MIHNFSISPDKKDELYNKYLKHINEVGLSIRQSEVISCLVHNRNYAKIAELLNISSVRTVQSHVRDIRNKFNNVSVEKIIDIVDSSGKREFVTQYYVNILIRNYFVNLLRQIFSVLRHQKITYTINDNLSDPKIAKLKKNFIEDLKLSGIQNVSDVKSSGTGEAHITLISESNKINAQDSSNIKDIVLLYEDSLKEAIDHKLYKRVIYCNHGKNYYFMVIDIILSLSNEHEKLSGIKEQFEKYCEGITQSWKSNNNLITDKIEQKSRSSYKNIFFGSGCIVIIVLVFMINNKLSTGDTVGLGSVNQEIRSYVDAFSADNISINQQRKNNFELYRKVESILKLLNANYSDDTYLKKVITVEQLANFLYLTHALASQLTYNEHDGKSARILLQRSLNILEAYINTKHKVAIRLHMLPIDELYSELSIADSIPQLYTRITYLLGRTYIYQDDYKLAEQYFKISEYLGKKLNLFEGYLSNRSGFSVLEMINLENDIAKFSNYNKQVEQRINRHIKQLELLKNDNNEYIMNFSSDSQNKHSVIVPSTDVYNLLFIEEQILRCYILLLHYTNIPVEKSLYKDKIIQFIKSSDTLLLISRASRKQRASIHNNLGFIVYSLNKSHLLSKEEIALLSQILQSDSQDIIRIIEQQFLLAKSYSRNSDYQKADAYDGLIQLYKLKIDRGLSAKNEELSIKKDIKTMEIKRNKINSSLSRDGWRLDKNNFSLLSK